MPRRSHTRNHCHTIILLIPCLILVAISSKLLSSTNAQSPYPAHRSFVVQGRHELNHDARVAHVPEPAAGGRLIAAFKPKVTGTVKSTDTSSESIVTSRVSKSQRRSPHIPVGGSIESPASTCGEMWFFSSTTSTPSSSQTPSVQTTSTSSPQCAYKPLFPPFYPSRWHAVDDRVRGGSSISHLEAWKYKSDSDESLGEVGGQGEDQEGSRDLSRFGNESGSGQGFEKSGGVGDGGNQGARFWGHLDTQTLGGAGFASQSYTFTPRLSLPETSYTGLQIILLPNPDLNRKTNATPEASSSTSSPSSSSPKEPDNFTLVLKSDKPGKREDGRREAVLTYEYTFAAPSASSSTSTSASMVPPKPSQGRAHPMTIISMPWSDFSATYRGRKIDPTDPMYVPLQPGVITKPSTLRSPAYAQWSEKPVVNDEDEISRGGIYEMSLMCRSDFGKQEGDFELYIVGIGAERVGTSAWDGVGAEDKIVRIAERMGVLGWLTGLGVLEVVTKVVIGICAGCQWVLRFFSQAQESGVRLP